MDLPLIGNFPLSPQPDQGLTPDVVVTPTLRDIIKGKDAEMAIVGTLQRDRDALKSMISAIGPESAKPN